MSFFAVLFALIIEQARPLARDNWVHAGFRGWARWANRSLDAGKPSHGWIAWTVAVVLPALVTLMVHWLLWSVNPLLAFIWSVAILYVTLGFRQFSHYFTDIRDALDEGDESAARELLAQWRQVDASELPRSEIVRHVIEYSVLAAHRHVFGVLAWFSVLAALGLGPAGAVFAADASQAFQAGGLDAEEPVATESTPGREPEVAHLRSIVGLVWRSVVLWMVLLALLTLARLLG